MTEIITLHSAIGFQSGSALHYLAGWTTEPVGTNEWLQKSVELTLYCSECYSLLNGAVRNTAVCRLCLIFQSLYGPRTSHPPALCPNSSFDAIFECPAGVIYVLKGELNTIYC